MTGAYSGYRIVNHVTVWNRREFRHSVRSTLVETVSINYEDFNESFLTCSTCLCKLRVHYKVLPQCWQACSMLASTAPSSSRALTPCVSNAYKELWQQMPASLASGQTWKKPQLYDIVWQTFLIKSTKSNASFVNYRNYLTLSLLFRCPICRELIKIPGGGVQAIPPSFLVNQLIDLMAKQIREVIPNCSTHENQVNLSQTLVFVFVFV